MLAQAWGKIWGEEVGQGGSNRRSNRGSQQGVCSCQADKADMNQCHSVTLFGSGDARGVMNDVLCHPWGVESDCACAQKPDTWRVVFVPIYWTLWCLGEGQKEGGGRERISSKGGCKLDHLNSFALEEKCVMEGLGPRRKFIFSAALPGLVLRYASCLPDGTVE